MKVGIYSGSFNPVHIGHVALADFIVKEKLVDEVWLIRSPQNPLKVNADLADDVHRANMLQLAVNGREGLKISTIEDSLPKPNYTIRTLQTLHEQYPEHDFYLIVGADNWEIFDKWREWETILRDFHLIVYPRPGYAMPVIDKEKFPTVQVVDAPLYDFSSTEIRALRKKGRSIKPYVAPDVDKYIRNNRLYK